MPETEPLSHGFTLGLGFLIMIAAWLLATLVRMLIRKTVSRIMEDSHAIGVLIGTPYYLIILIGVLVGLNTMGLKIAPVLTGLGLGGFVLGLALRDALSNLISGIMMLLYKPFTRGDTITVSGYSGTVDTINLRYTTLRGREEIFLIPNSTLLSSPIKLIRQEQRPG